MIKTFTKDELIRYAYGETNESENLEIQNALLCNEDLQEEFIQIQNMIMQLDAAQIKPRELATDRILNYSKSYKLPSMTN